MADCDATASFIDFSFAQLHGLTLLPLQHPRDLTIVDGRFVLSGAITHIVQISLTFKTHIETFDLFVTTLGQYPVILGLPWLRKHDPRIRFKENTLTFDAKYCLDHCISTHQAVTIHGADTTFDTLHEIQEPQKTYETRRSTSKPRYSPRSSHQTDMADCKRKINRELMLLDNPSVDNASARTPTADITSAARKLDIYMIGAAPFNHLVQKSRKHSDI